MVMEYDETRKRDVEWKEGDRSQNKEGTSNIELPTFNFQREKLCLLSTFAIGSWMFNVRFFKLEWNTTDAAVVINDI